MSKVAIPYQVPSDILCAIRGGATVRLTFAGHPNHETFLVAAKLALRTGCGPNLTALLKLTEERKVLTGVAQEERLQQTRHLSIKHHNSTGRTSATDATPVNQTSQHRQQI